MPKSSADVSNTAVRIFLHEIGKSHDVERGFAPYKKKDFGKIKEFFGHTCCFCGVSEEKQRLTGDHLVPTNRKALGLEAWGNIVPACTNCNEEKHFKDWREYMDSFTDDDVGPRVARIEEFITHYRYAPDLETIRLAVVELYEESGGIVDSLIELKLKRALERMAAKAGRVFG